MKLARIIVWLNSGLFAAFGLGFSLAPAWLSFIATGAAPTTPSAAIDMRATYGGMALGLAFVLALCARRPSTIRLGTQAVLATMISLAGTRAVGIVVDGSPNIFMGALLGAELLMAAIAAFSLRRQMAKAAAP